MRPIPSSSASTRATAAANTSAAGSRRPTACWSSGHSPTDFNTGGFTVQLSEERTIRANIRSVKIKHHIYPAVALGDFIRGLAGRLKKRDPASLDLKHATEGCVHRRTAAFEPEPGPAADHPPLLRPGQPLPAARRRGDRRDGRCPLQCRRDPHAGGGEVHRPDLLRLDRLHRRRHARSLLCRAGPSRCALRRRRLLPGHLPGPVDHDPAWPQSRSSS